MDSLTRRIAQKHIAAKKPVYGPITSYEDWLENNPELAKMTTVSPSLMRKLVMGLNLRAMPASMRFFQIVDHVYHMSLGAPVEDLSQEFRSAAKYLSQAVIRTLKDEKGAPLSNSILDCAVDNAANLRRIGAGAKGLVFTNFGISVAEVVQSLSRDAGFSAGYMVKTVEGARWPMVRVMSKDEEKLRSLQENNPELYTEIAGNIEQAGKFQYQVEKAVIEQGLVPTTVTHNGVPFPASEDYLTKEKTVYTPDGRVLPEKEFARDNMLQARKVEMLTSEFSPMFVFNSKGKPEVVRRPDQLKIAGLTKLSDDDLNDPGVIPPGPEGLPQKPTFRAMTDDNATKKNQNTRIYPTRRDIYGNEVIVDGRFKGFYLDDMVNQQGRLVEGAAYDMGEDGIPVAFETLESDGSLRLSAVNKEPYVTLNNEGKFLIKIPFIGGGRGTKDPFKIARDAMAARASVPEKVKWVKTPDGKRKKEVVPGRTRTTIFEVPKIHDDEDTNTLFTFEVQDFNTVRTAVGGMCLSAEAAKKLRDYYNQQARVEESTRQENTKSYSLDRIGGFKTQMEIDPQTGEPFDPPKLTKDLMSKQKEALSWIEAKGYKGLAALDTGVGKTLLTIATMQKMTRDGAAEEGSRFLYVCPNHLKGNFPTELQAWMTEEAGKGLLSRVDVMSYEDFQFVVNGGKRPLKQKVPGTEKQEKVLDPVTGKPQRGPDGKLVYRLIPGTEKEVGVKDAEGKRVYETVTPDPELSKKYAAVFFDEAHILVKDVNNKFSVAAQKFDHPRKVLLTASPMEDGPDELYIGVAITNNAKLSKKALDLPKGSKALTPAQKEFMAFRRRFVDRKAGRTMGIKDDPAKDPTKRQDFDAWVKNGMYFADKRTIGAPGTSEKEQKEMKLPDLLKQQTVTLTMDPEVEMEYRKSAKGMTKLLKLMTKVFRDKANVSTVDAAVVARFETEFRKYRKQLDMLANYPDEVLDEKGEKRFPDAVSSKVIGSTMLVHEKIQSGKRTLLFTDDEKFAVKTAEQMSSRTPDVSVAVALKGKVTVYRNGKVYTKEDGGKQVFGPREYTNLKGEKVPKGDWASHVLREIIGGDPSVKALVLTKSYALGQNLQMFSTVVHLDRDDFSNETMKQRTARAWRTGQTEPVEEYTMDTVYDDATGKSDPTLDEARRYVQEIQEGVFNDIVHKSREAELGTEWKGMKETPASLMPVNRKLFEMALAPYPANLAAQVYSQSLTKP
jgi:hypothetical protein